eukprot:TRINITY_DN8032_c0_g5_i1.p1 TRINITY_DN8032_c0_g5~~TRINITY_DN8032_c0_g5_i1.p1  ORF type:complete len:370 (+),score=6.52 TRINITY_DN8032_c0_g5_i1:49-1110(+)
MDGSSPVVISGLEDSASGTDSEGKATEIMHQKISALALDETTQTLFIAENVEGSNIGLCRIRRLTLSDGHISTFAGSPSNIYGDRPLEGECYDISFLSISSLCFSPLDSSLYVYDCSGLRKIDSSGRISMITNHGRTAVINWDPVSNGVLLSSQANHMIIQISSDGKEVVLAGDGKQEVRDGPLLDCSFGWPMAMAHNSNLLAVLDCYYGNPRIRLIQGYDAVVEKFPRGVTPGPTEQIENLKKRLRESSLKLFQEKKEKAILVADLKRLQGVGLQVSRRQDVTALHDQLVSILEKVQSRKLAFEKYGECDECSMISETNARFGNQTICASCLCSTETSDVGGFRRWHSCPKI